MTYPQIPAGGAVEAGEAISPEQIEAACEAFCRRGPGSLPPLVIVDWRVLKTFYPRQANELRQRMASGFSAARALPLTSKEDRT